MVTVNTTGYGSFQNALYGTAMVYPDPEVGMGATALMYSDRYPHTIVAVESPNRIRVRRCEAIVVSGSEYDGSAKYEYMEHEDWPTQIVTRRRNGKWVAQGEPQSAPGFAIGMRDKYHDPSF